MRQRRQWLVAIAVTLAGLLGAETWDPATAAAERKDPLLLFACQLTVDGLEGNRPELKPQIFVQSPLGYTVEMPKANNTGPLQGFIMTITLSRPNSVNLQTAPLLLMAHASAVHFSQATLQCMDAALHPAYQWVLSDVVLSAPKFPIEQIVLAASKADFDDLVANVKFTWDAKVNQGGLMTPAGPLLYGVPASGRPPMPGGLSLPGPSR